MRLLLAIALICVPIMLFVKPVLLHRQAKKEHHGSVRIVEGGQQIFTGINEGGGEYENYRRLSGNEGEELSEMIKSPQ